jgi:hypothetical protein
MKYIRSIQKRLLAGSQKSMRQSVFLFLASREREEFGHWRAGSPEQGPAPELLFRGKKGII